MAIELAQVYTDFAGLDSLKAQARKNKDAALDEVAHQFESLFMQMMLKSMRKAGFGGGLMDSKNTEFYRDMYDKQIAMDLSKRHGIGLAAVIKRQLDGQHPGTASGRDFASYLKQPVAPAEPVQAGVRAADGSAATPPDGTPEAFIEALWPAAEKAAAKLKLPPEALLAQAALETGWGKHVMRHADGSSSHNLFGIKADDRWDGNKVQVSTLEYRDGVAMRTRADFRAYDSWEQSFDDYVRFVRDNPRYTEALQAGSDVSTYFDRLQKAGYATDPAYAEKINRMLDQGPLSAAARPGRGA